MLIADAHLEELGQDVSVVLLVEVGGVDGRSHPHQLQIPSILVGQLSSRHVEPVLAGRLATLQLKHRADLIE